MHATNGIRPPIVPASPLPPPCSSSIHRSFEESILRRRRLTCLAIHGQRRQELSWSEPAEDIVISGRGRKSRKKGAPVVGMEVPLEISGIQEPSEVESDVQEGQGEEPKAKRGYKIVNGVLEKDSSCLSDGVRWYQIWTRTRREKTVVDKLESRIPDLPPLVDENGNQEERFFSVWAPAKRYSHWNTKTNKMGKRTLRFGAGNYGCCVFLECKMDNYIFKAVNDLAEVYQFRDLHFEMDWVPLPVEDQLMHQVYQWIWTNHDVTYEDLEKAAENQEVPDEEVNDPKVPDVVDVVDLITAGVEVDQKSIAELVKDREEETMRKKEKKIGKDRRLEQRGSQRGRGRGRGMGRGEDRAFAERREKKVDLRRSSFTREEDNFTPDDTWFESGDSEKSKWGTWADFSDESDSEDKKKTESKVEDSVDSWEWGNDMDFGDVPKESDKSSWASKEGEKDEKDDDQEVLNWFKDEESREEKPEASVGPVHRHEEWTSNLYEKDVDWKKIEASVDAFEQEDPLDGEDWEKLLSLDDGVWSEEGETYKKAHAEVFGVEQELTKPELPSSDIEKDVEPVTAIDKPKKPVVVPEHKVTSFLRSRRKGMIKQDSWQEGSDEVPEDVAVESESSIGDVDDGPIDTEVVRPKWVKNVETKLLGFRPQLKKREKTWKRDRFDEQGGRSSRFSETDWGETSGSRRGREGPDDVGTEWVTAGVDDEELGSFNWDDLDVDTEVGKIFDRLDVDGDKEEDGLDVVGDDLDDLFDETLFEEPTFPRSSEKTSEDVEAKEVSEAGSESGPLSLGDSVRVMEGPFQDFEGEVLDIQRNTLKVELDIFGRLTRVSLSPKVLNKKTDESSEG